MLLWLYYIGLLCC